MADVVDIELERIEHPPSNRSGERAEHAAAIPPSNLPEYTLSRRARICRVLVPVLAVAAICVSILVAVTINRDGIKDLLDEINPKQSFEATLLYLCIGIFFIWILLFFPASIFVIGTGFFYDYGGLAVLYAWLTFGIFYEYYAGRFCTKRYLTTERMMQWFPYETKYFLSFKESFRKEPYKLSFLVVSAPIPLGFNLLLIGLFTDVKLFPYASMAFLSCTIFMVPVFLVARNADNLEDALDPSSSSAIDFVILIVSVVIAIANIVYIPRVVGRNLRRCSRTADELEAELGEVLDEKEGDGCDGEGGGGE